MSIGDAAVSGDNRHLKSFVNKTTNNSNQNNNVSNKVPNVATSTTVADESSNSVKSSSMSPKNVAVIPKLPGGKKVLDTVVNMDVDQVFK